MVSNTGDKFRQSCFRTERLRAGKSGNMFAAAFHICSMSLILAAGDLHVGWKCDFFYFTTAVFIVRLQLFVHNFGLLSQSFFKSINHGQ